MDLSNIVKDAVDLLVPAMPFLIEKGTQVATAGAKALGEAAWEQAKAVWERLQPRLAEQPGSAKALEKLAKAPGDEDARGALRMNVRDIIEADPELAKALAQLLTQRTQVRVAGNRSVGVGGSVNGANIVTGDGNIVGGPSRTPDVDGPPKA